jgi:hypothetical protein
LIDLAGAGQTSSRHNPDIRVMIPANTKDKELSSPYHRATASGSSMVPDRKEIRNPCMRNISLNDMTVTAVAR